jgi:TatD DNase family protein
MKFIDTHTHIYLPEFDNDRDESVRKASSCGITVMLMPNIDVNSVGQLLKTERRYRGKCIPMMGLHPTSVKEDYQYQLDFLEDLFKAHKFIAVGEIGIDLYWDKSFLKEQIIAFRRQISFAVEKNLPVVIHSRDAFPEVFSVLDEFSGTKLNGVLHAFTGGIAEAEKAISMGLYLGIGGVVTFKNSGLDKVIGEIGSESIIYETDSPYLAPVPYRGKRNESSYIPLINIKVAEILGKSEKETALTAFNNSIRLFSLQQ